MSEAGPSYAVPFLKARRSLKEIDCVHLLRCPLPKGEGKKPKPCGSCIRPEHETKAGELDSLSPPEGLTHHLRRMSISQIDLQHEFYRPVLTHLHVSIHDGGSIFLA